MSLLSSLFGKKEEPIKSNADFWNWFSENEQSFFKVVKNSDNIKINFFDKLAPKLNELKEGIRFLTGMYNEETAELIFTADGVIKNIVFAEEIIANAPSLKNWKFTALKQPTDIEKQSIKMEDTEFNPETMSFYALDNPLTPDKIDIVITHKNYSEENKGTIINGVFLAIDNYLGELESVTKLDNVSIINPENAEEELVRITKLKDFITWREKEFVEKYEGLRYNTENDTYSSFEANLDNGLPLFAVVNADLLKWDSKASHPWIAVLKIYYQRKNNNGMPPPKIYDKLNDIEDKLMLQLKDSDGYLNIGRETADSLREVYFACVDFRKPSKLFHELQSENTNELKFEFEIYKDKYWQSFNRYRSN